MRLKSDLVGCAGWPAAGQLHQVELQWDRRVALGVVMAAHGYPGQPRVARSQKVLSAEGPDAMVFHAGTALAGQHVVT